MCARNGHVSKGQRIVFEKVRLVFSDVELNYRIITNSGNRHADVGIPSKKICIEYDGKYWHKNKLEDEARDRELLEVGWRTIRIPEGEEDKLDGILNSL